VHVQSVCTEPRHRQRLETAQFVDRSTSKRRPSSKLTSSTVVFLLASQGEACTFQSRSAAGAAATAAAGQAGARKKKKARSYIIQFSECATRAQRWLLLERTAAERAERVAWGRAGPSNKY
jgi:hypothetical protein